MILRLFKCLFLVLFLFSFDSRHKAHAETWSKVLGPTWGDSLIVSIPGTTVDEATEVWLEHIRPSGILLFRRNIKTPAQTKALIESLQQVAVRTKSLPYLILVDQEGGIVTRIHSNPPPPSLLALSHIKEPSVLEDYAFTNGQFLKSLGFHIVLAPVADIDDPHRKSFLGHRVVSKDPDQVINTLTPLVEGYAQANVLPTLKHFPGHGFLKDSHHEKAVKTSSLEELWNQDLAVYKEFADSKTNFAILTSHISLPKVDASKTPTTYSKKIVHSLIRNELKFNGLLISDDIEMGGALKLTLKEKIRMAVQAGHDLVIVTSSLPIIARALSDLSSVDLTDHELASEKRRQYWIGLLTKTPEKKNFSSLLKTLEEKIAQLNRLIFDASWSELLSQGPLGAISTESWTVVSSDSKLIQSFTKAKPGSRSFLLNAQNIQYIEKFLAKQKGPVLYHVSGEKTAKILMSFKDTIWKKILVLNSHYPGALNKLPASVLVLNLSTPMPQAGAWTAQNIDLNMRAPASAGSKVGLRTRAPKPD